MNPLRLSPFQDQTGAGGGRCFCLNTDCWVENDIVGEALVALHHDDLKSMEIASVGHRLTILKSVYDVKKAQDVPCESDHYLPLCMETSFFLC